MSWNGKYYRGAKKDRATDRYRAAVGRQLLMHDRGFYIGTASDGARMVCTPAPTFELLRRGDSVDSCDFRSYAEVQA